MHAPWRVCQKMRANHGRPCRKFISATQCGLFASLLICVFAYLLFCLFAYLLFCSFEVEEEEEYARTVERVSEIAL